MNRQPGKALPFFLRLRRPNVLDLIRTHNLFTDVQDQALLLVEFDHELMDKRRKAGEDVDPADSAAIKLLVDHTHSIPVGDVLLAGIDFLNNVVVGLRSAESFSNCRRGATICICIWTHCSPGTLI